MIATRGLMRISRIIGERARCQPRGQPIVMSRVDPLRSGLRRSIYISSGRSVAEATVEDAGKQADTVKLTDFKVEAQIGEDSFVKLLRNSALVHLGDPEGKVVEGRIYHVIEDDLYVDFGGKFHCVCVRPMKNGELYTLGRKVRVMVHDLELSTRFLGAASDLTILEADGTLLGLAASDFKQPEHGKSITEELLSQS